MTWAWLAAAFVLVVAATAALTGVVLRLLRRYAVLDRPSARSSHAAPTPRGGGLAVLAVLLPAWAAVGLAWPAAGAGGAALVGVLPGALLLAAVSWIDDLRGLDPRLRLAAHALAVGIGLAAMAPAPVFQGLLPPWLDRLAAGLAWLWFVNLFNFMDGIDGLAASETACLGGGLALIALVGGAGGATAPLGLTLAAAGLGFLLWNRPPAKLFLGDVGSVPLGYLAGWLLLDAASAGAWAAALILPAYYLADATLTLAGRAGRGESVTEAHAEHFYQRAVRAGRSHGQVVLMVLAANAALIALALGAERGERIAGLVGAAATVTLLLRRLMRPPKRGSR